MGESFIEMVLPKKTFTKNKNYVKSVIQTKDIYLPQEYIKPQNTLPRNPTNSIRGFGVDLAIQIKIKNNEEKSIHEHQK